MFRVSLPHLLAAALALAHATAAAAALSPWDPQGVHLAFGRDDDSMVVGYTTLEKEASFVEYRLVGEDGPSLHATGVSRAFVDGGDENLVRYVHFATLRRLRAGAAYAYRVGVGSSSRAASTAALAKTNPPREKDEASFSRWFAFRAKRSKAQVTPSSPSGCWRGATSGTSSPRARYARSCARSTARRDRASTPRWRKRKPFASRREASSKSLVPGKTETARRE